MLVVDAQSLSQLDSLDGVTDTVIDVDGLIANSDPSNDLIAEFTSASGAAFTVAPGPLDTCYIITFADGRILLVTTPGGYATFTLAITPVITVTEIRLEAFGNGFMSMDNANLQIACFTRGSQIKTQSGEVAIEDLAVGDRVETLDHGLQPIRWIGSSKRHATGNMAPILIRKGALGNTRDLRVSPQHRMLLSGWHAEVLFGEREVLATAKSLVNDHSILREEGGEVEYFHMLFDTHEIVYAEGAPSESFHPGPEGWKALDEPTRNEILELFPQLANGNFDSYGPSARASLKYKEGSLLSHSMISQTQH